MIRRALICLAVAFVPAATASAQSGVVVDPGSPTGKEYAIPLDSAREDAAPGGPSSGGEPGNAPLFGEGVGEPTTGGGTSTEETARPESEGGSEQTESRRPALPEAPESSESSASSQSTRPARPVAAAVPDGGSGSTLTVVAVALSVLLLGGVAGSIARRRSS